METANVQSNLSNLASDAASIEKDGGGFMQPGEKRKRGRPKKVPGTDAQGKPSMAQAGESTSNVGLTPNPITELLPLTKTVTTMYSGILVMYAEDERAALGKETQENMSQAGAHCLQQYFPGSFGKHGALILLATIVSTTGFNAWILRRENLAKLRAEKENREKVKGFDGPQPTFNN